eukprot:4973830-Prymnesium_polylepis.1
MLCPKHVHVRTHTTWTWTWDMDMDMGMDMSVCLRMHKPHDAAQAVVHILMAHPQATCNSASAHARRSGGSPGYSRCPTRPRWSSSQRNCPQNSRSRPSGGWHIRTRSACKVRAAIACMPPSQHAHNCDHHAHAHMPRACSPMCMNMDMDMSMHMLHQHAHAHA